MIPLSSLSDDDLFQELTRRRKDSWKAGGEACELVATWMIKNGFVTGHGDNIDDLLMNLVIQARESRTTSRGE